MTRWLPQSFGDILGILTLVVTAAFLYYTIRTWKEMVRSNDNAEKSGAENDRSTTESLRLTRESNDVTRRSLEVAQSQRDTLANALKAWITLSRIERWSHKRQPPLKVRVALHNTGFSPALAVHPHGGMKLVTDPAFLVHEGPCHQDEHEPLSVATVGAGGTLKFDVDGLTLTPDERKSVDDGTAMIYLHGSIEYIDAFGGQRRTKFVALYEGPTSEWTSAPKHNEQT